MIKFFDNYPVSLSMPAHPRGYKYSHKSLNISVSHVSQQKKTTIDLKPIVVFLRVSLIPPCYARIELLLVTYLLAGWMDRRRPESIIVTKGTVLFVT